MSEGNALLYRVADALERIADGLDRLAPPPPPPGSPQRWIDPMDRVLIEELVLSPRAYNCLKRGGYRFSEQVQRSTDDDLLAIPNLGDRTLAEIREAIDLMPEDA